MYKEDRQEASYKVSTMDEKEAQRLSKHHMLLRRGECPEPEILKVTVKVTVKDLAVTVS